MQCVSEYENSKACIQSQGEITRLWYTSVFHPKQALLDWATGIAVRAAGQLKPASAAQLCPHLRFIHAGSTGVLLERATTVAGHAAGQHKPAHKSFGNISALCPRRFYWSVLQLLLGTLQTSTS